MIFFLSFSLINMVKRLFDNYKLESIENNISYIEQALK